jgi:homoserine kinase
MNNVKVYSPGSIGNVGCGFDVIGLAFDAVGDIVEVTHNDTGELRITEIIGDQTITTNPHRNIVTVGARALLDHLDANQGFDFKITKGVAAGSGMGSSGCSATAGVFAINEILSAGLTKHELLPFAAIGEQVASEQVHYDNIGPSMLGGLNVVRSTEPLEILELPTPEDLIIAIAKPNVIIKTEEAKKLIPKDLPLQTAIKQFGQIAGLVTGSLNNDIALMGRSVDDYIATPYRAGLIPKFNEARIRAIEAGAAGFNISGSGPAMFALCDGLETAQAVISALKELYADDPGATFFLTKPDKQGTRLI